MSSDSGSTSYSESGYTKKDFASFLKQGNRQASGAKPSISQKERKVTSYYGDKDAVVSGVQYGDYAKVTDSEISKLVDIFQKRSEDISNRRLSPGVTQTRLIGR